MIIDTPYAVQLYFWNTGSKALAACFLFVASETSDLFRAN